ncbi:ABC transporter permease [Candidatus Pacearchaeota archaeon]|nr:ABC transporter permease [Candidatus Pacearchaeota archaeon]
MLGIFIGIAAVVSLITLGNALQGAITGQFDTLDPDKLIISNAETGFGPPGSTAIEKLNDHDLELIENVNGVDLAVQRLIRTVTLEYNKAAVFGYATNIPENDKHISLIYDALNVKTQSGRLLTKDDRKKVVLGHNYADSNNDFGKAVTVGKKIKIQGEEFEVIGILEQASSFITNQIIILPDEDIRRILGINKEIDIIVVQVDNLDNIETIANNLEQSLRRDRSLKVGEEDFSVETPQQGLQTVNNILAAISAVIVGIASISLLVGGIGIANTMYTSVLERTREIGVMKAVGARNKDILSIFLFESALLGLAGGIIGALIGLTLAFAVSFTVSTVFPTLNFNVNLSIPLLSLAILFSLVIGTVSGVLPALQASKLRPVEALRA